MIEWRKIFYLTVGVQLSGVILFTLFGSAEPLNLDSPKSKPDVIESAKTEIENNILKEINENSTN